MFKKIPATILPLLECEMPKSPKPLQPEYPDFNLHEDSNLMLTIVQNEMCLFTRKSLINWRLENLSAISTPDTIIENLGHEYDKEIFLSDPLTLSNIPTLHLIR